jgi:hypothetical protein
MPGLVPGTRFALLPVMTEKADRFQISVQAAECVDQRQNRKRHPEQPQ